MKIIHIHFEVRAVNTRGVHTLDTLGWLGVTRKILDYDFTLFASAILADEAIYFDNSIFAQILHKHEECGMSLLNTSSFRLFRKA